MSLTPPPVCFLNQKTYHDRHTKAPTPNGSACCSPAYGPLINLLPSTFRNLHLLSSLAPRIVRFGMVPPARELCWLVLRAFCGARVPPGPLQDSVLEAIRVTTPSPFPSPLPRDVCAPHLWLLTEEGEGDDYTRWRRDAVKPSLPREESLARSNG